MGRSTLKHTRVHSVQQASSLFFISDGEFIHWLMNHACIRLHPSTVSGPDHARANNQKVNQIANLPLNLWPLLA